MRWSVITLFLILPATTVRADAGLEFFEKKVRPILAEQCYSCHSEAAKKKRGGLLLDTRSGIRKGGETGPAVVPGKPAESLLLKAIRYKDETLKMPPRNKLPDGIIADLELWIKLGAPDPRDRAAVPVAGGAWEEVLRERRRWWSLQPVKKTTVPAVKDAAWSDHVVDRFILARLEEKGLKPADAADRRTLIRRLSLVLTGLPPTPEEVEAFARNEKRGAVEELVDRLLASPHFGERWARHWMDVVRFTETHGNEWNYEVHHAWRYRDYLIRAFNDDVPYDQFVREHIAGDLLAKPRWNRVEKFNESVIGTAFYRFGEANHDDCIDLPSIGYDLLDNQIDTLTKAFQATTVACARCHDHKIDAVSMKDYHALLGTLRSSRLVSHTLDAPDVNAEPTQRIRDVKAALRKELGDLWMHESSTVGRYLLAAQARIAKRPEAAELARGLDAKRLESWVDALNGPMPDDLLEPWRAAAGKAFGEPEWKALVERYTKEDRERTAFNEKDFMTSDLRDWQIGGQGLRQGATSGGEIALAPEGDAVVRSILPSGYHTHALSDRLNGTLRSRPLTASKKYISFLVQGQRSSAVRLVSNNCQLNYRNYKALTSNDWQWITFPIPSNADSLRVHAELMTMFDNPKFPDQLSALGGDSQNYRLPWEKAAANPRSYFGVSRVVLHNGATPPKPPLSQLRPLLDGQGVRSLDDFAARYSAVVRRAARAFQSGQAGDDDARWLDFLVKRGLLPNSLKLNPRIESLVQSYRETERGLTLPRVAPGIADCGPGIEQPVLIRGDCTKPGEKVTRRYLEVLSRPDERFATGESGRRELAEKIASPDNPLTARVMVNRVWHHLFGTGLVRSVDDFGRVGDLPSHPELLDHLAACFVVEGWSVKRLVRSLVLTRTFLMANRASPRSREVDPLNRLLQHYPARRMEAEAIRDSILAASGRLDRSLYGHSIPSPREGVNADRRLFPGPLDGGGRRSVYIRNTLMEAPRFLSVFDFPGGKVAQGRRDVTSVPAQALALLNDPFVLQQAEVWACRLIDRKTDTMATRIEDLFCTALGRPPSAEERERFEKSIHELAALYPVNAGGVMGNQELWKGLAHTMYNLKEFIYIP